MNFEQNDNCDQKMLLLKQSLYNLISILAQRQKEAKEAKELRRKRSASLRESRNSATKSS